ncbi:MAG: hypothetical protein NC131_03665 [Roseburia sp.]|nr:hypothetical protein [Roseburia sp.]
MNKFKKVALSLIIAAGAASCLCGAAACSGSGSSDSNQNQTHEPEYYLLDLNGSGVDIVFEGELAEIDENGESFRLGGKVKEGVEVRFKVLPGVNVTGTPVISVNDAALLPDADGVYSFKDGVYSFKMEKDSQISVTGLKALHTLKFSAFEKVEDSEGAEYLEERWIKFYDETGTRELDGEVTVSNGDDFKFRIWKSPYYKDDFTVICGFEELVDEDNDGVYVIKSVGESGEVSVTGLTLESSFANFAEGYGDGSAEHPYQLSKPVDLYYLAALINDDFYGGRFASLHYELTADIDMDGERLFVIGDNSTTSSAFCGSFDGKGHTIKNFRITDEVIDQSEYTKEYLPYVGLFGYAVATVDNNGEINPPVIKNLNLKDYTLEVHTAASGAGAYAGSLLGFGIGAEITNCHAESGTGSISVINDNNQIVNVGGLVGRLQGAYGATEDGYVTHNTFVRSSSADVALFGTGCPRAAGGIVGYLISAEENAIGYVVNCYSKGSINGAMHSGGIVGTLGRYSTVADSYSSAQISANNQLGGVNVTNEYKVAYAGGIVGYAEENTVIYGCYAANYTSASVNSLSAVSVNGANFMATGAFAGAYASKPDASAADYDVFVAENNSTAVANNPKSAFVALGWSETEWDFSSGALPKIIIPASDRGITVKIEQADNPAYTRSYSLNGYSPLSGWYKKQGGLPEYIENARGRSFGYYFDKALTKKAPYGFVPVKAETVLYAGFADYTEVAGVYYVGDAPYSNGAYIELTADGKAKIRNGGLSYVCNYSYSGSADEVNIILYRSCLAALSHSENELNGGYFAYGGKAAGGKLTLSAYLTLVNSSGSLETGDLYVNDVNTITAVKAAANFVYGEYKDENGAVYVFRNNGTGVKTVGNTVSAFTFVPAANSFNIMLDRAVAVTVTGNGTVDTIDGVAVSKADEYKGSWKKTANGLTEFNFDGEGKVALNGGTAVEYTPADNGVGFEIDSVLYKATFVDGNLCINGEIYYKNDGFTGEWFMLGAKEQIQVTFNGIGTQGYGTAVINYSGGGTQSLEAEYDVTVASDGTFVRLYVGDRQYGELKYEAGSASGSFYSLMYSRYDSFTFHLYDLFRGSWAGATDAFDAVTFNGRSASANDSEVAVRSAANVTTGGTYTLTDNTHGTMTVGGKTYSIYFNGETGLVEFEYAPEEGAAESGLLGRRDGWYGVQLTDGTLTYSFDGKSAVGGKVNVSDGTALDYVLSDGAVTLGGNALTPAADGFNWTDAEGGDKKLTFNTGFAGEWLVSGVDNVLTVNEVGGFMTASVTATGVAGASAFTYDPAAKTLNFTDNGTVTLIKLMGENEMSITCTLADGSKVNYNCLKSGMADSWKGVYNSVSGSGSWKFDGLGACRYGSGTAIYTPADGEPVKYGYRLNELGVPYIRATENMVFIEADEDEEGVEKFEKGDKKYKAVTVNIYYGRTVYTEESSVRKYYFFDGVSTVWEKVADGEYANAYTYEVVTSALCEFIKEGVRYNARLQDNGLSIKMTVSEQRKATAEGVSYAFGVSTLWEIGEDGSYKKAYEYTAVDETKGEYELTDGDGKVYTATLKGSELTITAKENS